MDELNDVAQFVCELTEGDLPEGALEAAKAPVIDCLGVTVAGLEDPASRIVAEWVDSMQGAPRSSVFFKFLKTSPPWAALANGTAAHALDYDDVSFSMMGHPSVTLVPAIIALAEAESLSGKECLLAYVAGLEVMSKVGLALGGNSYLIGWHQTSTLGALGATASCGKLLGLNREQLAHALGIACSLANGIRANFGTMTKPLHAGMAAMNGVMAAQLASRGFTSNPDSLFGENGFAGAFSADTERCGELKAALGNPYEILVPGLSFKPYPCCRGPQGAIDAALNVHSELSERVGEVSPSDIEKVECRVPPWLRGLLTYHLPQTGLEGKFSLEFCVSVALLDGKVGVGQFKDERVLSRDIVETMGRVEWIDLEGDYASPFTSEVVVELKDGARFASRVEKPLGEPGNPMGVDRVYDKYLECVKSVLGDKVAERTLHALRHLDAYRDIGELVALFQTD